MSYQQDFIQRVLPAAREASRLTGIPPSVLIAQAAYEAGWDKNSPTISVKHNNPWAVKYPQLPGIKRMPVPGNDAFAFYPDLITAARDYALFVDPANNPRYAKAWAVRHDPYRYIEEISKAGYEDGRYKDKPGSYALNIQAIIRQYNLTQYDGQPATAPPVSPQPVPDLPQLPPIELPQDARGQGVTVGLALLLAGAGVLLTWAVTGGLSDG